MLKVITFFKYIFFATHLRTPKFAPMIPSRYHFILGFNFKLYYNKLYLLTYNITYNISSLFAVPYCMGAGWPKRLEREK